MLISLLVSVMSYQYGPDLATVYENEAFHALVQGVLFKVAGYRVHYLTLRDLQCCVYSTRPD